MKQFDLVLVGNRDLAARVFAAVSPRFPRTGFVPVPSADHWRERFLPDPEPLPFPPASDEEEFVVLSGPAAFLAPDRLRAGPEEIVFKHAVLLIGAEPVPLGEPGAALAPGQALSASAAWDSAVVVGAGPTGVAAAQRLAKRSVAVTLLAAGERILPRLHADIASAVEADLRSAGVTIERGARAQTAHAAGGRVSVVFEQAGRPGERAAAGAVAALGFRPATAGLALDKAGVLTRGDGSVVTNDEMRTSNPRIFAAGAATGVRVSEAMERFQAELAAANLRAPFFNRARLLSEPVPAVFPVEPGLASLNDAKAPGKRRLSSLTSVDGPAGRTVITLAGDRKTGALHAAEVFGRNAAEIVFFFDLARQMELSLFDLTEANHFPDTAGTHALFEAITTWQKAAGR